MSKPEDIPQDVWDAAVETTVGTMAFGSPRLTDTIARAIMAAETEEREACAKIAEKGQWEHRTDSPFSMSYAVWVGPRGPDIASAIRKRGES